ncbi:hypothetical protein ABIA33_002993 [Streptacidiphilus sp. MAP12-16]|uniref:putative Ig domain-containing protein n=1 Tax=Streptacidiphilus sp. MAP12-16 TaxID=3156300 RepID=UPI00351626E5
MAATSSSFRGRHRRHLRTAALAAVVVGGAVLVGDPASAASSGVLRPYVNCVTTDAQSGIVTAYFGYENTLGKQLEFGVGQDNQIYPASPFQGQPTFFNEGNYPQGFSVAFDPKIIPSVDWILDGQDATASVDAPACANGVTSPASGVTAGGATLTGVVVPSGTDTTYSFAYGTTTALGSSTTARDFGTGTQPQLVQATLTGLTPSTQYYFRIVTSSSEETTQGQTLTFTTPAAAPLAFTRTQLGTGTVGTPYTAQLAGTGGITPYTWSIVQGALPAGLTLNAATGAISGTPTARGAAHFTVELSDGSLPKAKSETRKLHITINPAKSPK